MLSGNQQQPLFGGVLVFTWPAGSSPLLAAVIITCIILVHWLRSQIEQDSIRVSYIHVLSIRAIINCVMTVILSFKVVNHALFNSLSTNEAERDLQNLKFSRVWYDHCCG